MILRFVWLVALLVMPLKVGAEERMNVLMIAVDDLRPELACYGAEQIHSPNIDRLASEGLLFENAFCQVAVCGASRASLLSGTRPETTGIWDYKTGMRSKMPDVLSLPQHFRKNGYHTVSLGKIYHVSTDDYPQGWSEKPWKPKASAYVTQKSLDSMIDHPRQKGRRMGPATENGGDVPDNTYGDGKTAEEAVGRLQEFAESKKPFFLAVGFTKPHLPFVAPGKYWDLYDRSDIVIPDRNDPLDSPEYARSTWGELKAYSDIESNVKALDDAKTRELIHGYYATVSYMDKNVGHVLDALDQLGLARNTVVVLWGDHGWYLGEFGDWCKHSNDEVAARVPLIVRAPNQQASQKTTALVEFVDVFPSLCEIVGLDVPKHCQGHSFAPLLQEPELPWKEAAFSQYQKSNSKRKMRFLGTSVRTERWRYTEWRDLKTSALDAVELYDLQQDPGATRSVHENPENSAILARHAGLAANSGQGVAP